jgi:membrane-anchored glycerophosphoryl diester phosphodiesterase (GDPDase)
VFRDAVAFITRRPGPAAGFALLSVAPAVIASALGGSAGIGGTLLVNIVSIIVYIGCMGASAAAAADPGGQEMPPVECLRLSFSRTPAFLLITAFLFLAFIALMIPLGVGMGVVAAVGSRTGSSAGAAIVVLTLLLTAAIAWVYVLFCLTVPACVLEELGPSAALRRSMELTRGSRLRIFAVFLLLGLAVAIIMGVAIFSEVNEITDLANMQLSAGATFLNSVLMSVLNMSYFAITSSIYITLSSISESARVNDFSEVF